MKKIQPKMEELKAKHGDDRMALQQATMQLYKDEKINPVAGCWPVLLQIPVFFSLYKVIYVTIEMRQAPFFGWIRDLSAPTRPRSSTCSACCPSRRRPSCISASGRSSWASPCSSRCA